VHKLEEAVMTGLTAEAAVERVQSDTRARMLRQTDPFLRERLHDLDDLANRLMRQLTGRDHAPSRESLPENAILVARSMGPAALLDYDRKRLRGLVLEEGGPHSHVAIVARAIISDHGLLAWDVDRLVALTERFPRIQVPLSAIRELDEPFWSDDDTPTWRAVVEHVRLIEAADLSYAIILSSGGRVMDGMHRVAKAVLLGRSTIEAVKFTDDPEPDYVGMQPNELPYDNSNEPAQTESHFNS
jgi:hypothetical protein